MFRWTELSSYTSTIRTNKTFLFLFCYERDFMLSLSDNNQTDIIEA